MQYFSNHAYSMIITTWRWITILFALIITIWAATTSPIHTLRDARTSTDYEIQLDDIHHGVPDLSQDAWTLNRWHSSALNSNGIDLNVHDYCIAFCHCYAELDNIAFLSEDRYVTALYFSIAQSLAEPSASGSTPSPKVTGGDAAGAEGKGRDRCIFGRRVL